MTGNQQAIVNSLSFFVNLLSISWNFVNVLWISMKNEAFSIKKWWKPRKDTRVPPNMDPNKGTWHQRWIPALRAPIQAQFPLCIKWSCLKTTSHHKKVPTNLLAKTTSHASFGWSAGQSISRSRFADLLEDLRHPSCGWSPCQKSRFADLLERWHRPSFGWTCSQGQSLQTCWKTYAIQKSRFADLLEKWHRPSLQPKVNVCKPAGKVTPSKLWLKPMPKIKVCRLAGKVTPSKLLLNL